MFQKKVKRADPLRVSRLTTGTALCCATLERVWMRLFGDLHLSLFPSLCAYFAGTPIISDSHRGQPRVHPSSRSSSFRMYNFRRLGSPDPGCGNGGTCTSGAVYTNAGIPMFLFSEPSDEMGVASILSSASRARRWLGG